VEIIEGGQVSEARGLVVDCADLMVNVGIIDSVRVHWPEEIQANWDEKIRSIRRMIYDQIYEVQEFASSYDQP